MMHVAERFTFFAPTMSPMSAAGDSNTIPYTKKSAIDAGFLEHRSKVLDLAAFLDRIERAPEPGGDDFRVDALRRALSLLQDGKPERARRVLELWSDHSTDPIPAAPMKGALGAVDLRQAGPQGGSAR